MIGVLQQNKITKACRYLSCVEPLLNGGDVCRSIKIVCYGLFVHEEFKDVMGPIIIKQYEEKLAAALRLLGKVPIVRELAHGPIEYVSGGEKAMRFMLEALLERLFSRMIFDQDLLTREERLQLGEEKRPG